MDVKTLKLISVRRKTLEEALKSLNVGPKILAKRSNALWNILLALKEEVKQLVGSIVSTKSARQELRLTEYMGS